MKKKLLFLIAVFLTPSVLIHAQEEQEGVVSTDTLSVKVYFRQGHSTLDPAYRGNAARLEEFASRLRDVYADTLKKPGHAQVTGSASPEGPSELNDRLSKARIANLIAWVGKNFPNESLAYNSRALGIDWDGLARLVEQSDMTYRDEVLDVLNNTPEWMLRRGKIIDERKQQLGKLNSGSPWKYMEEHIFPELRVSTLKMTYDVQRPEAQPVVASAVPMETLTEVVVVRDTVVMIVRDTVILREEVLANPLYIAVKTNLLYDLLLVPNIGAEFYLGKGWSIGGNWMYAWWSNDNSHYYWRTYGGEIDVRKYFGRRAEEKPLTGHHLGLYVHMLTYDFELGGTGYLSKFSYGAGIEYGYSLPIAKRLNLDFGIGVGYLGGEYMQYEPVDMHYVWQGTKNRNWFGPTKAEISLIWLIGSGNTNK